MPFSRTTIAIIAAVAILAILIGITTYLTYKPTKPPEETVTETPQITPVCEVPDRLVIGLSISLSGAYALAGQQGLWGIQSGIKWVNDVYGGINICGKRVKLELKYYDDQSSKDLVPGLYERLITVDKVDFLFAPYGSPLTLAAAPVAEKYGKLIIAWMANSDKLIQQGFRYFVMVPRLASTLWHATLEMVRELDPTATIAIIHKEDEFNTMVARGAKSKAEELGLKVVYLKSYPVDITDFTPILIELKTVKPDVILICSHEKDGMLAMQQLYEQRINAKLIGIAVATSLPKFYENFGILAEGIVDGTHWTPYARWSPDAAKSLGLAWFGPSQEEFISIFKSIAGPQQEPSYHAVAGFAAVLTLVKAIETANSIDQLAVRNAYSNLKLLTIYGPFQIDPETGGQIGHKIVVGQWQNKTFQIVWPKEAASSKPVYPIPTWEEKLAGKLAVPSP